MPEEQNPFPMMPYRPKMLQLLIENARDYAIVMQDTEGRVILWNPGAQNLLGWQEEEIVGQPATLFFTPEDQAAGVLEQEIRTAVEQGRAEGERWHVRKDGSRFWGNGLIVPIVDGELHGYLKIIHDLTEQKHREQMQTRVEHDQRLLQAMLDALPAGVCVADPTGRLLWFNPAFKRIWGGTLYVAQDVADDGVYVGYKRDTGERIEPQEWAMARALQGKVCPGELVEIEKFDGSGRNIIVTSAAPVRDAAGEILVGVSVQMDVTDQAGDAESLRRHQAEIERLHDCLRCARQEMHARIKNNFQTTSAMVEMLADELGESSEAQRIKAVRRVLHYIRILTSIHDMLSRQAEEDRDTSIVSVTVVLQHALHMLQEFHPEKRIQADLAEVMLPVSKAVSLCFLVCECMNNAIQHAREQVEITLSVGDGTVRVEVCDDGPGFPSGFDPRKAAHTGLELIDSTARWDLRGEVYYENREQVGGRVVVTFPLDVPTEC